MNHEEITKENHRAARITIADQPGKRFTGISPYDIELDRIERMELALQSTLDPDQARLIAAAINDRRNRIRRIDLVIHDLRLTNSQRRERMEGVSAVILPDNPFDEYDSRNAQ